MAWRRHFWIAACFCSILMAVGCTSQQNLADSPGMVESPVSHDLEATSTAEIEQPPTEPAAVEIEPSATAVQSVIPTTVLEPTTVPSVTPTTPVKPTNQQPAGNANADVLYVLARQESENTWRFTVTVEHPDTGWEDYADGWDVLLPDGSVARPDPDSPFTRLLLHPHETEQPFTRSQGGIVIAPGISEVTVRAHDIVDGFGGREVVLDLMLNSGPDFEVQRIQ